MERRARVTSARKAVVLSGVRNTPRSALLNAACVSCARDARVRGRVPARARRAGRSACGGAWRACQCACHKNEAYSAEVAQTETALLQAG